MATQFGIYKNKKGEFRRRLRAKNKKIIASGHGDCMGGQGTADTECRQSSCLDSPPSQYTQ
jgi:hypothetical protein